MSEIPDGHEERIRATWREIADEAPAPGHWDYWTIKRLAVNLVLVGFIIGPLCWATVIVVVSWLATGSPDTLIRALTASDGP